MPDTLTEATAQVQKVKDDYGTGLSTLIMIYNATGSDMIYYNFKSTSGEIWLGSENAWFPKTIRNGQWALALHVHRIAGSVAAVGYNFDGSNNKRSPNTAGYAIMGWDNPLSGDNHIYAELGRPNVRIIDYIEGKRESWDDFIQGFITTTEDKSLSASVTDKDKYYRVEANINRGTSPVARFVVSYINIRQPVPPPKE